MHCYRKGRIWPVSRADYDDNTEARGFTAVVGARGPFVIYGALYATVALNLIAASLADCDGTVVGGLKASSVVATLATVEGVANSVLSPFFGGFADTTPHRKPAIAITFAVLIVTLCLQGGFFLSEETDNVDPNDSNEFLSQPLLYSDVYFVLLMATFAIQTVDYELAALLTISYSPELTTDERKQHGYIADAFTATNAAQLVFLAVVTGLSIGIGLNGYQTGVMSAFVCAGWASLIFFYAYPKLGERREVNKAFEKKFLGLFHLKNAFIDMKRNYPDILLFLLSWAPIASASASTISLATSYLQFHLNFSSLEVQALLGSALLMTVPGAVLARVLSKNYGISVKRLYMMTASAQAMSFIVAPFFLTSSPIQATSNGTLSQFGRCEIPQPGDVIAVKADDGVIYIVAGFILLWGTLIGLIYPLNVALFALLVPGGQETTYFGIKVTFSKVLNWLAPLLFTVINEAGSLQYALLPLGATFGSGVIFAYFIDMDRGLEAINHTVHMRRGNAREVEDAKSGEVGVSV